MTHDATNDTQRRPCWSDAGLWQFSLLAMAAIWLLWIEHHAPLVSMLCGVLPIALMAGRRLRQAVLVAAVDAPGFERAGTEVLR